MLSAEAAALVFFWTVPSIGMKTIRKLQGLAKRNDISLSQLIEDSGFALAAKVLNNRQQDELKKLKNKYTANTLFESILERDLQIIINTSESYPKQFSGLDDMPLILFCKGNIELLEQIRSLAVVGTRRMTPYGARVTKSLVKDLVLHGFQIVSGFMYGVDVTAQNQALNSGGSTVGVLGFGFDHCYPISQKKLFDEMIEKGALFISEFPPETIPAPGNFPRRNRIVAALSLGVLVVEAAKNSGSHITANYALDYGKSVFSVPGPIDNPYSIGTKTLINQGAKLVDSAADIIDDLSLHFAVQKNVNSQNKGKQSLEGVEKKIYEALQQSAKTITQLESELELAMSDLNVALSLMEVKGMVSRSGDEWFLSI